MPQLPEAWKEEFARLRAERDAAFRELTELRKSIGHLTAMMARQNEQLDQIVSILRRREAQLQRANAEVRKLRRKLGLDDPEPDPAEAPAPESPYIDDDAARGGDAADATEDGASGSSNEAPLPEGSTEPKPGVGGGRRPPPEHLPTDVEHHGVCTCSHDDCEGRVLKKHVFETSVYSAVTSYVRRRLIRREGVICADCLRPTTAPMPPMPCERALYDCSFLAWLVVMKFVLLVPLDRIRQILLSQGVNIPEGSLVKQIERAAGLADAIDGEHMKQLKVGAYMHFDGTGLKTLVLGQEKAWDGYLEVFTRDELTVFQFDMTKHADRLLLRINEFMGVLVCDAESRNEAGAPGIELAKCNAHARRKFRDAERVQPRLALQGARFIQALYAIEREADELKLSGAERVAFRRRRSRRVLHWFKKWLEGVLARDLPPSDPVRKVAKYYLKHFDDLTRFVDHPAALPLDNNAAEREFQRHAKLRQACLFAGSPEGAHRWATLFGVVRTAQKCGLDVQAYLTWLFERRGSHKKVFGMTAAELTPMAYRDMLREVAQLAA